MELKQGENLGKALARFRKLTSDIRREAKENQRFIPRSQKRKIKSLKARELRAKAQPRESRTDREEQRRGR